MTLIIGAITYGITNSLLLCLTYRNRNIKKIPLEYFIFLVGCIYMIFLLVLLGMIAIPAGGISLISNIIIPSIMLILVPQLILESIARTNIQRIEVLSLSLMLCFMAFVADQQAFFSEKMPEGVPITYIDFPETNDILIIDASQPEFVSTDVSILEKVEWESLSHSNGKKIIRSSSCDVIVIIEPERIVAYRNIETAFVVRNTMPHELMLKNPRNLGFVVDDNDIPYYKYALLRRDSFGNYVVGKYALCNALTFEVSYFDKLPNWAN